MKDRIKLESKTQKNKSFSQELDPYVEYLVSGAITLIAHLKNMPLNKTLNIPIT